MMKEVHGDLIVQKGQRFCLVVSRFNEFLTKKLLDGAIDCLTRHGCGQDQMEVVWVPGSFELTYAASKLVDKDYSAVICLGTVIRGETPHFDYINQQTARTIASLSLTSGVPVIYGIVTADTLEQALNRCGVKDGNKGWNAASTAIEMANLYTKI